MAAVNNARGPMPADPHPRPIHHPHLHHPSSVQHSYSLSSVTDEVSITPSAPLNVTAGICAYARKRAHPFARMSALNCGCVSILKVLSYLPVFFYFQF